MNKMMSILTGVVLLSGVASPGYADWKSYVWTYEYMTMPQGKAELEYYLRATVPDRSVTEVNAWRHQVEVEYGLTDHLDISMYQMWTQKNTAEDSAFQYDGFKIRSRYRFGEKGQFFVDPLLYVEYKRNDNLSQPNIGEAKVILARDIGGLNISYNQIAEMELSSAGKVEHKYAVGVGYRIVPAFKLSLESLGNYSEGKYAVGPTASLAGGGKFVALGIALGLNNKTDDLQSQMIAGFLF